MYKSLKIQFWATGIVSLSLLAGCYSKHDVSKLDIIENQNKAQKLVNTISADALHRVKIQGISQAYEAEQDGQKLLFVPADAVIEKGADELEAYTLVKVERSSWERLIQKAHPELNLDRSIKLPSNAITDEREVKRLINGLQSTELVKSLLCGNKNEPAITIYETKGGFPPKHIFVEEPALQIATRHLRYKDNKRFFKDAIIVVVAQTEDWKALDEKVEARKHEIEISKEGVKTALDREGKLSEVSAKTSIEAFPAEAIGIDKFRLYNALIIPESGNSVQKSGVNISARAINMLAPAHKRGYMSKDVYDNIFQSKAPKSFGDRVHKFSTRGLTGIRLVALAAAVGSVVAAPFTGGASLLIPIAFLAPALIDDLLPTDLGISPGQLAEYSAGYLGTVGAKESAEYEPHSKFEDCVQAIRSDVKKGKPVIVFWTLTSKSAQYAAVVGVTDAEFIIMQPDGYLYRLRKNAMKVLMKRQFWSYVGVVTTHKNYHLVRFKDVKKKKKGVFNKLKFWKCWQ